MNDNIKMFIAGEEVVSQNEFTINEEMLSASSTILNNCYPKSWELTKDYISNFYYPKDYSRFVLAQGEYVHGNQEFQPLEITSKNLLDGIFRQGNINGTNTSTQIFNDSNYYVIKNTNYTISTNIDTTTYKYQIFVNDKPLPKFNTDNEEYTSGWKTTSTFSFNINVDGYMGVGIVRVDGGNLTPSDISNVWFQLEEGNQATAYEPYNQPTMYYKTNVEKEWHDLTIYGRTYQETSESPIMPSPEYPSNMISAGFNNFVNAKDDINTSTIGLTYSYDEASNEISIKGTPTRSYDTLVKNRDVNLEPGVFTFSISKVLSHRIILYHTFEDNTTDTITMLPGQTCIVRKMAKKIIQIRVGLTNMSTTTELNEVFKVQFERGTPNVFIPYGVYGVEVRNTGKNLFNKNNVINGYYLNTNGDLASNGNYCVSEFIPVIAGEKYYIPVRGTTRTKYFKEDGSVYSNSWDVSDVAQVITIPTGVAFIRISLATAGGTAVNLNTWQFEKGTQATTYEPYKSNNQLYLLTEPLRAINNVKDRLYYESGYLCVERKIGSVIFNGTETGWSYQNSCFTININGIKETPAYADRGQKLVISDYFAWQLSDYRGSLQDLHITKAIDSGNPKQIAFKYSTYTSTNDFKTWLSTHNTEVNYILATPKIETYGKIPLPSSYEGDNNVNVYSGLNTRSDIWYYWKNYDVLFAGVVKNSGDISLNPRYPHYCSLQILDYKTFLSESNTLDFVIANKTVSEAIEMVVNAVSGYGFIVGNIDIDSANDIIGAYSTLNKTAYDVLQYLAEISGSRWRARVVDSLTMAIDFYDPDTLPQAPDLLYTKEHWEQNNIVDLTFNYGTRDYRNKQILLSDEVYGTIEYDETLISNGYSDTFTLQNNVGSINSIVVNSDDKTFATSSDKQMGVDSDFYYTPGKNTLESNGVYPAGTMIHLRYQPLVKGRQIVYNNSEVERIKQQTQTEGVIARYETRNDILSNDELEKIAQTYIEYKGKAEVILTLRTQNNDIYNIGEVVYFNAPIADLKQNYMVKAKSIEYVVINKIINLFYIYELTSSFNSEKAINYFDNQRNKASGNISDGEAITRNVDIETEAKIIWTGGTVSSATVTVTGDNVLNSILNSPFVE